MRDAADYVWGNAEGVTIGSNDSPSIGTIKLLDNITDAVGLTIGRFNQTNSGDKDTRVTIDLNNKNLIFAQDLEFNGTTIGHGKVLQFIRKDNGSANGSTNNYVEIKNGKIAVKDNPTDTFQRLIRSYVDLKLTNVTLDGTNVKDQGHDADSALLCISAGSVTLDGTTNIITQPDINGQTYYAIGLKPSSSARYENGNLSLNVSVTADSNIPNIVLYEWPGALVNSYSNVHLTATSGNIGEIKISEYARSKDAVKQIALSGANIGTFDYDTTAGSTKNTYLVYGGKDSSVSTRDDWTYGIKGWNAASNSSLNTEYSYVTTSESSGSSTPGTVALNVKNVSDNSDLAFDEQAKVFAVPANATASEPASGYKLVALSYSRNKDVVTISSASDDAFILSGDYSVKGVLGEGSEGKATGILASTVKKIDASGVNAPIVIGGNSLANEIYGGTGEQKIFLGAGSDTFYYSGGQNTIQDYVTTGNGDKDIIRLVGIDPVTDGTKVKKEDNDLVLEFSDNNKIRFVGVAEAINGSADGTASTKAADQTYGMGITVGSGNDTYVYKTGSVAQVGKGITLTNGYTASTFTPAANYSSIDASAATLAVNITGDNQNTYIIGSESGGILYGATGNDTLKGSGKATFANTFVYTDGKDVIENYQVGTDKVSLGSSVVFTGTKESSDKFTFNINSGNSLTFKDFKPETDKITLVKDGADSGALTKDGVISGTTLKLFAGAKGDVDLKNSNLYGNTITTVDATDVKGQAVNLIAGTAGGTFSFAANNGRKDTFTLGDASATINGYEAGKDKIDLGNATIASFTVNDAVAADATAAPPTAATPKNITLNLSGGKTVVINDIGNTDEVLIHDGSSKSDNAFGKKIFLADNVLADKKTPTSATVMGNDNTFNAATTAPTVKKLFAGSGVTGVTITAGNANNSTVNASVAGTGVNLVGGDKNDKLIGSSDGADVFTYTKGKDVIQNYDPEKDTIAFAAASGVSTLYAIDKATKIAASDKSIKLTFANSDVLNVKGTGLKSGGIKVGTTNYTFGKNAIISEVEVGSSKQKQATLTSAASGSVKAKNFTDVKYFDGQKVTKNLTFTGSADAEQFFGGQKKTVFKGGGGADTLTGGYGKDTFFYAKGDKDTVTIADFDFKNDNLKIANGTIKEIVTVSGGGIQFNMTNGAKKNPQDMGSFKVISSATYNAEKVATPNTLTEDTSKDLVIKANSTYYWFETTGEGADALTQLVTTKTKISASDVDTSKFNVIDLTYSTNLLKSNVAKEVATAKTLK